MAGEEGLNALPGGDYGGLLAFVGQAVAVAEVEMAVHGGVNAAAAGHRLAALRLCSA
ncbi:hypothetical protein [Streptomyces rimosus]|uniref:hypothetical protein n=1 Tax=Streptomyces rimosus TaxID=1927 RepID=UPI00378E6584